MRAKVDAILADAPIVAETESIETPTMVRAEQGIAVARMVELRAVEAAVPVLRHARAGRRPRLLARLLVGRGALVGPELLVQLGLRVGDRLMIGGQPFTIRGVIAQEPGRRIGAFRFGARVIVDLADLRQTGLLGFGSRASYQRLLKVREDGVDRLTTRLRRELRDNFVSARSYASLEDDIGEDLIRAENYLSLVGFVDRRARRHRRVERDARLRAAEDQERRHPQVPRRDDGPGAGDLRRAGGRCLALPAARLGVLLAGSPCG